MRITWKKITNVQAVKCGLSHKKNETNQSGPGGYLSGRSVLPKDFFFGY